MNVISTNSLEQVSSIEFKIINFVNEVGVSGQGKLKIELINSLGQFVEVSYINGASGYFSYKMSTLAYRRVFII